MRILSTSVAFLAIVSLSAPAVIAKSSKATEAKFRCENGKTMKVVFGSNTATVIYNKGKPVALQQSLAGDGFAYATSKYNLRGKGNRVTWAVRGKKPVECRGR